jgi:hypothetical protein
MPRFEPEPGWRCRAPVRIMGTLTSRGHDGHCRIRTQWYPVRGVWAVAVAAPRAGVHHRLCEVVVAVRALGSGMTHRGRCSPEASQPVDGGGVMSHIAAFPRSGGHRYSWCPSCHELWLTEWMAAAGVDRCPACDRRVLAYVGRSPYDMPGGRANDPPGPGTTPPTRDGRISAPASISAARRSLGGW